MTTQVLQVFNCGLTIYPSLTYLAASPDGLVQYKCCGKGVTEVKCPYQCKHLSFRDASTKSSFCLEVNVRNGNPLSHLCGELMRYVGNNFF